MLAMQRQVHAAFLLHGVALVCLRLALQPTILQVEQLRGTCEPRLATVVGDTNARHETAHGVDQREHVPPPVASPGADIVRRVAMLLQAV